MIKVINPLYRKEEADDLAFNCACVCTKGTNNSTVKSSSWLPWNGCQANCQSGNTANQKANKDKAKAI